MIFFFKKNPIVLHCVTERHNVLKLAPVHQTIRSLPDWWKKIPHCNTDGTIYPQPTMKHCAGFIELYKSGITVPMWSDLALVIGETGTTRYQYQYSDRKSEIVDHPSIQHNNHFDELKFQHLKLMSPWKFVCEDDTKFLFVEPTWTLLKFPTLTVLPGVTGFKYQSSGHINLFVRRTETPQEILIPFLEPILHLIPLSDRPVDIRVSDDQDMLKRANIFSHGTTFIRTHLFFKKAFKKFQENK